MLTHYDHMNKMLVYFFQSIAQQPPKFVFGIGCHNPFIWKKFLNQQHLSPIYVFESS